MADYDFPKVQEIEKAYTFENRVSSLEEIHKHPVENPVGNEHKLKSCGE